MTQEPESKMTITVTNNTGKSNSKTGKQFPATCWTDINGWEKASVEKKKESIATFFKGYRTPIINFIISMGNTGYEAEDIFQDFVAHHLTGNLFIAANPAKGKFRNLLLTSVKRFTIDCKRKSAAQKRHPKEGMVHLESEFSEKIQWSDIIGSEKTPEDIYEVSWLLTLLSNVTQRLEIEFTQKGKGIHFKLFRSRVIDPILTTGNKPGIQKLAEQYKLKKSTVSNYIVTAKRAYQRILRDEIRQYTGSEKEVTEEINDLFRFLQRFNT